MSYGLLDAGTRLQEYLPMVVREARLDGSADGPVRFDRETAQPTIQGVEVAQAQTFINERRVLVYLGWIDDRRGGVEDLVWRKLNEIGKITDDREFERSWEAFHAAQEFFLFRSQLGLNEAIWKTVKGRDSEMPDPRHTRIVGSVPADDPAGP